MLRGWTLVSVMATYVLLIIGGVVSSTGSGLGCGPDWPLCHGYLIPPFSEPEILIEWLHRLVAGLVGLLVLATAIEAWRGTRDLPSMSALAGIAVLLLLTQVILGAITVRWELPPQVSTAHLATGTALFAVLVMMSTLAFRRDRARPPLEASPQRFLWLAVGFTFVQMVLGAYVRHSGAGMACSDPIVCVPSTHPLVLVQFAHRALALVVLGFVHSAAGRVLRATSEPSLRIAAFAAMILVFVQIGLGILSVATSLAPHATTAHLGVALALLGALVFMATRVTIVGRIPAVTAKPKEAAA